VTLVGVPNNEFEPTPACEASGGDDCEAGAERSRDEVRCGTCAYKSIGVEVEGRLRHLVRQVRSGSG
jgi:hypothetical protein